MSSVATPLDQGYDAALAGAECSVVGMTATPMSLPATRWRGPATETDHRLLDLCEGATLDVGCGPGRMTKALLGRGQRALGIDVSRVAVAIARGHGVPALVRDVFGPVPAEQRWSSVLLADGNIGIGGSPNHLLHRVGRLLAPAGVLVLDLAPRGVTSRTHEVRLVLGQRSTRPFSWSVVGADDIGALAQAAGFTVDRLAEVDGRCFARLRRWEEPPR